jgi:chromosome segregation ATPase
MAKQYQAEREDLRARLAKTQADLEDLRARQDSKGKQGEAERTKLRELMAKKDERIAVLEDELRNSAQAREQLEAEVAHLQSQIGESQAQETELLLLREQLVRLAKSQNVPSDMLKAETTRADTFKKRTIELSKQVANLQETLEQQSSDLQYLRKQGAAIRLHSRDPNPSERQDYKDLVSAKLQLENTVELLTTQIKRLEAENEALHSQVYERSQKMSMLEQEINRRSVEMLRPEDSKNMAAVMTVDLRSMKADIQEGLEGMHPQPVIELRGVTAQAAVKASSRIKENLLRILAK